MPVGHPDFGVPVRCACKRDEDAARAATRAARASNLTDEMRERCSFTSYSPSRDTREAWATLRAFSQDPDGPPIRWLVLAGGVGTGKTHLLAACANELLSRGRHPLYVVVPDFLDYLRAAFAEEANATFDGLRDEWSTGSGDHADISGRMHAAVSADVLLLDDLGAEKRTAWSDERLYMLLNARYNAAAPTVIATNVTPDSGLIEGRIASRMSDVALSRVLVLVGDDYRLRADRQQPRGTTTTKKAVVRA